MKVKYLGHSCFVVNDNDYSIVLDPYKGVRGFKDINLEANEVICSHSHFDHAYTDEIKLINKESPFKVSRIKVFHDDKKGTLRGENYITVLESNGKRIVHLGDLGHMLDKDIIDELIEVDVLMIPVGGFYTIGPDIANRIVEEMKPKYIIPMHYKDGDKGLDVLKTVEDFINIYKGNKESLKLVKGYDKEIDI